MVRNINCPMQDDYDPQKPVRHGRPVHHAGLRVSLRDYPDECLWAQLQWEREQADRGVGSPEYLANLDTEWQRRDLCSRCLRDLDHPFMASVDELRKRAEDAEQKLAQIDSARARLDDQSFRLAVSDILDEDPDEDGN